MSRVIHGDCLQVMPTLPDKSIDMILCDLPYGTTACKWDTVIPFEPLWVQYKRLIKDNGAIVLTASQPFTSALVMSNLDWFKYELIWEKSHPSGIALSNKRIMKYHENILIFYGKQPVYNPIKWMGSKSHSVGSQLGNKTNSKSQPNMVQVHTEYSEMKQPKSIIKVSNPRSKNQHPTQKPVALFEYLIRTYTNENETVLDNCAGSGTTAIACLSTNRNYILIEKEKKYIDIINKRIAEHEQQQTLFEGV